MIHPIFFLTKLCKKFRKVNKMNPDTEQNIRNVFGEIPTEFHIPTDNDLHKMYIKQKNAITIVHNTYKEDYNKLMNDGFAFEERLKNFYEEFDNGSHTVTAILRKMIAHLERKSNYFLLPIISGDGDEQTGILTAQRLFVQENNEVPLTEEELALNAFSHVIEDGRYNPLYDTQGILQAQLSFNALYHANKRPENPELQGIFVWNTIVDMREFEKLYSGYVRIAVQNDSNVKLLISYLDELEDIIKHLSEIDSQLRRTSIILNKPCAKVTDWRRSIQYIEEQKRRVLMHFHALPGNL